MEKPIHGDPQWAVDATRSSEEVWKLRAEEQLRRSRELAASLKKAEEALRDAEDKLPLSIGKTPEDAIVALAKELEWGEVFMGAPLEGDGPYTWGYRFLAGGTSFKAAGWSVPGGVVLTWWK
jgi:nucleotide-binding universal stress UspA family protein